MAGRALHRYLLPLTGLLLLAFALRLFRLDFQSIWWDEGISLHLATSSIGEIIRDRLDNIHPPLYFLILKGWLSLVGVSPFTGRYLSVLVSLVQVALVFAAVRYWGTSRDDSKSGLPWIAALLMLLFPLSVIYGQEIRVYAMLPLAYIAALLLAEWLLSRDGMATKQLALLALVEWIGLHLHYIVLIGVAYIALWGLVVLGQRRDWVSLRGWVILHGVVAMASVPWMLAVLGNWSAVQAEANAGTFTTEPVPLPFLFSQVWAFHLTGLAGSLASRFVQVGSIVTALLVAGLAAYYIIPSQQRVIATQVPRLARHWVVPLLIGLAVWSVRSFSHPRYIVMFAAMLIPFIAFLIYPARGRVTRVATVALTICIIALNLWGVSRYFFNPAVAKPDIRGAAAHLEIIAGPGDVIFIPDTDWSLPFEYDGLASVIMPSLADSPQSEDSLLARALDCRGQSPCAETGRAFVIDYPRGTRDWQGRLPFELERRGYWSGKTEFNDVTVREYRVVERAGPLPPCDSLDVVIPPIRFGSLLLEGVWVEQGAAADTAVAIALCWRVGEPPQTDLTATLVLQDPETGELVSQSDDALNNSTGAPTTNWRTGEQIITYHLLPLPLGTPPVDKALTLGVYHTNGTEVIMLEGFDTQNNPVGQLVSIGDIELGAPVGLASLYDVKQTPLWEKPIAIVDGLQLLGARYNPGPYRPGQAIRVGLTWQLSGESMNNARPALALEQGGAIVALNDDVAVNGRYPIEQWREGEIVFENRDLRAPADSDGTAQLTIILGDRRVGLGEVVISGAEILYELPAVHSVTDIRFDDDFLLAGFDPPPQTVTTERGLPLTLYWQSLSDGDTVGYSVFTHLLDESGAIIAQHDSPPANGQRPTNEWLPGEFVVDAHELTWREPDFFGEARLAVGLYDPATGRRLLTAGGADSFILPIVIQVVNAP